MPTTEAYIGRWAAREGLCAEGVWRFEARRLATAGEVSCDFTRVQEVPDGYDIGAICLAEGNRSEETVRLRFAGSADRMLVESKTFQPIELIRCKS